MYGGVLESVIKKSLYSFNDYTVPVRVDNDTVSDSKIVSGHIWSDVRPKGPRPCDVMVISKMVGESDALLSRVFTGRVGDRFLQACRRVGADDAVNWYVTNAMKIEDPTAGKKSALTTYINQFAHLLQQELRIVQPTFILCMGADALKSILGKSMNLKKIDNQVCELTYQINKSADEEPQYKTAYVMGCTHPMAVLKEPRLSHEFEKAISRFAKMVKGNRWDTAKQRLDHRVVANEQELAAVLKHAEDNNPERIVAVDAEWEGQHPQNRGSYLRCVQFSWADRAACTIALTHPGGKPRFKRIIRDSAGKPKTKLVDGKRVLQFTTKGGKERALQMLDNHLKHKRLAGFFLASDAEWLLYHGLDLRKHMEVPDDWVEARTKGPLYVELLAHSADESDSFELNAQVFKWTSVPKYDKALTDWIKEHLDAKREIRKQQKKHNSKELRKQQEDPEYTPALVMVDPAKLNGYGQVPDDILYPYAGLDADVTRRLALVHMKRVDRDEFGNCSWEPYWADARAMLPLLEMNVEGLVVDRERLDDLTQVFIGCRDDVKNRLREWANWNGKVDEEGNTIEQPFNLESLPQVKEFLFGERFNGLKKKDGTPKGRIRPTDARSLYAKPIINTDKRPVRWNDIIAQNAEDKNSPSTKNTALGIMLNEGRHLECWSEAEKAYVPVDYYEQLRMFQDYRFLNQVLKTVLRPPRHDPSGHRYYRDEDGNKVYERGLGSSICTDGRVRTFLAMLLETGRWSSSRPNLQNISKRREKEYKRILGPRYKYALRSIFKADPGTVLVEADYIGAELFVMAVLAQDKLMIEHALRNQLPEDHERYYDIHSNIAVMAFKLDCPPTKNGLASIDKVTLRIVAKSVIFGIAYGRGAKAIALAAREEGIDISVEEAQAVIDAVFEMYPSLVALFTECRVRAARQRDSNQLPPRFLINACGRIRRFPSSDDRGQNGDYEREAMNFPIQSMVADAIDRAAYNIYRYREEHGMKFRMALQIHDALLFCVPYDEVDRFITEVLPLCMCKDVPIWPATMAGDPIEADEPYHLGIDTEISENWGETLYPDWLKQRGIPVKHAGWEYSKKLKGYTSHKKAGKFWRKGKWFDLPTVPA